MAVVVVNKYKVANHIYCGRGSALGNPFRAKSEADRDRVCDLYEEHFHSVLLQDEAALRLLRKIYTAAKAGDVNLGCFCAPKRCHCDTIKRFIDGHLGGAA